MVEQLLALPPLGQEGCGFHPRPGALLCGICGFSLGSSSYLHSPKIRLLAKILVLGHPDVNRIALL